MFHHKDRINTHNQVAFLVIHRYVKPVEAGMSFNKRQLWRLVRDALNLKFAGFIPRALETAKTFNRHSWHACGKDQNLMELALI
jgi:hypothetical protein